MATADWLTPQNSPSFGDTRFILMGTAGSAHVRAYAEDGLLICSEKSGRSTPPLPRTGVDQFAKNMIDAFARGEENFVSTQDVLATARVGVAAEKSAANGGELIRLPETPAGPR